MHKSSVIILMATYNGSLYVEEQIQSIIDQTYSDWELIIRDDGSTDNTVEIVKSYLKIDNRIKFIKTISNYKGACANFSNLYSWMKLNRSEHYVMFSDQDDIWMENKIQVSIDVLKRVECGSNNIPFLAYGNLDLVNELGKPIDHSLGLSDHLAINTLIAQNCAFGCTMIMNKQLVDKITNIPETIENHDYWIALSAASFGKAHYIEQKLIKYRQHSQNVTNQKHRTIAEKISFYLYKDNKRQALILAKRYGMIKRFYDEYSQEMGEYNRIFLKNYFKNVYSGRFALLFFIIRSRIKRFNFLQNVAYLYINFFYYKIFINIIDKEIDRN